MSTTKPDDASQAESWPISSLDLNQTTDTSSPAPPRPPACNHSAVKRGSMLERWLKETSDLPVNEKLQGDMMMAELDQLCKEWNKK